MTITLVLGGARSGKSTFAEQQAFTPKTYIATAQAFDDEMRDRIALHQAQRGDGWRTIEEPLHLPQALAGVSSGFVLVDCLTLWLSNLLLADMDWEAGVDELIEVLRNSPKSSTTVIPDASVFALGANGSERSGTPLSADAVGGQSGVPDKGLPFRSAKPALFRNDDGRTTETRHIVLVSNEVGLGIVPDTPLGRRFRDAQGITNQRVAQIADSVILMVAGIPMAAKGPLPVPPSQSQE